MYAIPHFHEPDEQVVLAFLKKHPFATLVVQTEGATAAVTQVPLLISQGDDGSLRFCGHVMKGTDHHRAMKAATDILVLFTGPHGYVSAAWYDGPPSASTWNYLSVQAKGKLRFRDEEGTIEALRNLTNQYEGEDSPASFSQLATDYIAAHVKAIEAFDIDVYELKNTFKLSQNKSAETQRRIIEELNKRRDTQSHEIAMEMSARMKGK